MRIAESHPLAGPTERSLGQRATREASSWRALPARILTLSRIVGLPAFLWLMLQVAREGPSAGGALLAALYVFLSLSDFLDGRLARRAGTADPVWGRIDVVADILFNVTSLGTAAALGLVGAWVPAGVAVLGGRFLWRAFGAPRAQSPLEDRVGKLAGVGFYLLVGVVVGRLAWPGLISRPVVTAAGDAIFLYTVFALWHGRAARGALFTSSPDPR